MTETLQHDFDAIQQSRNQLFKDLENYTEDQLNQLPKSGGWSVLQVIQHLILVEQTSLMYVQKKTSSGLAEIPDVGLENADMYKQMQDYLDGDIPAPAPPMVANVPERSTLAATRNEWDKVRQDILEMLSRFGEGDLNKATYKHPLAGRLTIGQMLGFHKHHFNRHRRQIERVIGEF